MQSLVLILTALVAQAPNPFDAKGYIEHKEIQKLEKGGTLSTQSIFRINGQRYVKLASPEGAVFLPSPGSLPELHEEFALCPQHLGLMNEVLPMRENMPVETETRKHEKQIVGMIRKCVEGRVAGPTVVETQPDGAVVEKKAKEHNPKPALDNK